MADTTVPSSCFPSEEMLPASIAVSSMDVSVSSLEISVASEQRRRKREDRKRRKPRRSSSPQGGLSRPRSLSEDENKARWQTAEPRKAIAQQKSLSLPRRKRSDPDLLGLEEEDEEDTLNGTSHSVPTNASFSRSNENFQVENVVSRRMSMVSSADASARSPRLPFRTSSSDRHFFRSNNVSDETLPNLSFKRFLQRHANEESYEAPSLPMRKKSFMDLDWNSGKSFDYLRQLNQRQQA